MDCRQVRFSSEKSQERIHKALQVFPRKLLMRILAFAAEKWRERIQKALQEFPRKLLMRILALALHLLGARRKEVAALVEMPEESVKTLLRLVLRDGFTAVRDRRFSAVSPMA
ncbi:MAG: hypothetical protein GY701_11395, partial [Sulfitobacter sp.]|nr:hypothetical protein [Sulfitobacter sp.]